MFIDNKGALRIKALRLTELSVNIINPSIPKLDATFVVVTEDGMQYGPVKLPVLFSFTAGSSVDSTVMEAIKAVENEAAKLLFDWVGKPPAKDPPSI